MNPSIKSNAPSSLAAATVSIVIPVYNQSHLTARCLESLASHSRNLKEVFVIDNASKDDTAVVLEGLRPRFGDKLTVIRNEENRGFGRAINQGLRLSTGTYLVILNNDTWLMPDWDLVLVQEMERARLDVIAPYFYERPYSDDLQEIAARFVARNRGKLRHHFAAILFMMTRGAFERLKFADHGSIFDERFFVTYEDTDLLRRMRDLSMRYAQTGSCFVWHHSMASRSAPGALPPWYEQEGLKLFIEKWGYDPRPADHTWLARARRRWWKLKDQWGKF